MISEEQELKILQKSAKKSSDKALRASKAMGLTIKFLNKDEIIEESPNGNRKVIRKIAVVPLKHKGLKKGTILYKK